MIRGEGDVADGADGDGGFFCPWESGISKSGGAIPGFAVVGDEVLEVGVVEGSVFGVEEGADGGMDWLVDLAGSGGHLFGCVEGDEV